MLNFDALVRHEVAKMTNEYIVMHRITHYTIVSVNSTAPHVFRCVKYKAIPVYKYLSHPYVMTVEIGVFRPIVWRGWEEC